MNYKIIFNLAGKVSIAIGCMLVIPLILAICLGEQTVTALAISIGIAVVLGVCLVVFCKPTSNTFFTKEGLITVALSWIVVSVIGALPFVISGEIPSFIDAFFESVSGFTTTGATVLTDELLLGMSKSLLLWRSFTHWIGGMGVLVFVMALSSTNDRSMHFLRAEMPGPTVDKITPRAKDTATTLYLIYIGLTVVEFVFLVCGEMSVFEAVVYTFGTAGTGGFGLLPNSLATASEYSQWVIGVFMLLFGINFNIYYLLLLRRFKSALSSRETWIYLGIIFVAFVGITADLSVKAESVAEVTNFGDALRVSFFQVVSFITTTGYGTASVNDWPVISKTILFLLMFVGGCAGSTAGGLKVSRVVLLFKKVQSEVRCMLHPRTTKVVQFEGKVVDDSTLDSVTSYFALYCFIIVAVFVLIGFDGYSLETNLTVAVSCVNNIGPAYGSASANYSVFSPFSTLVLSFAMLLGRLEIYPLLIALSPATWIKK